MGRTHVNSGSGRFTLCKNIPFYPRSKLRDI